MERHEKSEAVILLNLIKNGIEHFLLAILAYVHYPQKKVINSLFIELLFPRYWGSNKALLLLNQALHREC